MTVETGAAREFSLSPSALNLFLQCPRCFWLDRVGGVKRPRGIFPSLPGGMDREIKAHFDAFRAREALPPELCGHEFEGVRLFPDQDRLERWRNWRTGPVLKDAATGSVLSGAFDDLLVKDDLFIPLDYKTKGSPTSHEDAVKYYQNQLDCYALLLEANRCPTAGFAFLLYYSPKGVRENGNVLFEVQPIRVPTSPPRALETFRRAVSLLRGPLPGPGACEFCEWLAKVSTVR